MPRSALIAWGDHRWSRRSAKTAVDRPTRATSTSASLPSPGLAHAPGHALPPWLNSSRAARKALKHRPTYSRTAGRRTSRANLAGRRTHANRRAVPRKPNTTRSKTAMVGQCCYRRGRISNSPPVAIASIRATLVEWCTNVRSPYPTENLHRSVSAVGTLGWSMSRRRAEQGAAFAEGPGRPSIAVQAPGATLIGALPLTIPIWKTSPAPLAVCHQTRPKLDQPASGSNPEHIECLPHEVRWRGEQRTTPTGSTVISSVAVPQHAGAVGEGIHDAFGCWRLKHNPTGPPPSILEREPTSGHATAKNASHHPASNTENDTGHSPIFYSPR